MADSVYQSTRRPNRMIGPPGLPCVSGTLSCSRNEILAHLIPPGSQEAKETRGSVCARDRHHKRS
ncbi:MAG: hypothetical protein Kow001_03200 [Acidobacteriota bacterium]